MPVIIKRPSIGNDLFDIWYYIADHSEVRVDAFIDMFEQKFRTLASNPGLGREGRGHPARTSL